VEESLISAVDFTSKTTRPNIMKFDAKGKVSNMLPALKNAPTIYTAFEARTSTGDIIPGVQKSYIFKSAGKEGDISSFAIKSRTYVFPAEKAAKGYELTTKKSMDVGIEPVGKQWGFVIKESIKDISAKEGIIRTIAKGGNAKVFESFGVYTPFAKITKTYDFSKTIKLDQGLSATIQGKKATYNINLFKGTTITSSIGSTTTDKLVGLFKRSYPKSNPKTLIIPDIAAGKSMTTKEFKLSPSTQIAAGKSMTTKEFKLSPSTQSFQLGIVPETKGSISLSKTATKLSTTETSTRALGSQSIVDALYESQKTSQTTRLGTIAVPVMRTPTASIQGFKTSLANSQTFRLSQVMRTGMDTGKALRTSQLMRTNMDTSQLLRTTTASLTATSSRYAFDYGTPLPSITEGPPRPGIGFPSLPPISFPPQLFGPSPSKNVRFNKRYAPSLTATVFNIKGPKPSDFAVSTGLGIRPILRR
jgi:hypothetical protein